MKKFLLSIFCCLMAFVGIKAEEATLSFASTAQRTSYSTSVQVWEQNGITFTNDKASSSSDVANYSKPVRLYANSKVVVECSLGNITKIVFDCNSSSYATALKNSISSTATASSDKVTVTLDGTTNSFNIAKLTAQVRLDALTVTYVAAGGGTEVTKPVTPTLTAGGNFVGSKKVEISCATEGAEIYYTTDGTEPTEDSEAYVEAFDVTETTTVKAIAVNEAGASNVATAVYTRVAATPEISFDEATFEESVEVTIEAAEGTTVYYTLNGKTPTKTSDEYTNPLTIKADATLQVIAYDEDGYASPVAKQVFKKASVGGESTGKATLVEDVDDLTIGDKVVIVAADSNYALSTTQNSNNRGQVAITKSGNDVELNDNVQILTVETGTKAGTFAFNTGSGFLYAASSSSNHLKTQTTNNDNGSWKIEIAETGVATIVAQGTNTRNMMQYNKSSSLFSCYAADKPQQSVNIYKVNISTVEDYILDVTEAGWATMYLGYNVIIPTGVKCYVISAEEGNAVISETGKICLEEITEVVPANTAVIVEAEEGEYAFVVAEEGNDVVSVMAGTTKNEYIDKEAYVLGVVDGEVGLYKAAMNGGVWLNNANKAYLPASAIPDSAQGAASYSFSFDWNGTTAIENIEVKKPVADGAIYDLTGRKINSIAVTGIYIINGKKVFVRK